LDKNILLVEDDLNLGFLLMEFLEDEGYQVKLCRDGESGLQQVKATSFDLCILDIMLPRLLCLHQNQVLKREDAVEQIYGKKDYFLGRSFDVFISRLRKLLKNDPRIHIENVFKVGFILKVPDA